jgi:hypothetical protein
MRAEHRDFQLPEVRFQTAKAQVKYADSNCSIPRHVFFDLKVYLIGSHFFELTVYQSKRRPNHCKMQTEQDPLHWFRRALDKVFCFRTRGIITWYRSPRRTLNVISLKHICPRRAGKAQVECQQSVSRSSKSKNHGPSEIGRGIDGISLQPIKFSIVGKATKIRGRGTGVASRVAST